MKKLLLTQASGNYEKIRELIYPNFRHYADQVGADFFSIEDCKSSCPVMEKLRIYDFFDEYDRILFLDGDLIIRPDCPDLFKLVPEGYLAGYDEGAACRTIAEMYDRLSFIVKLAKFYSLPMPCFDEPYFSFFNAGVLLADKCHKEIFKPPVDNKDPRGFVVCPEQIYINYFILKFKPNKYHLPVCFNQMPWNWTEDYKDCSYIVHYASLPLEIRLKLMKGDLEYWRAKNANYYCHFCDKYVEPKIVELVKGTKDETCPICTNLNLQKKRC